MRSRLGDLPLQLTTTLLTHQVAPSEHNHVGSSQRATRFTEHTSGQKMAPPPGIRGIQENNVQVAVEPAVLKTIVQQQYLCTVRNSLPGQFGTILPLPEQDAR
jgi:hypothetical protein